MVTDIYCKSSLTAINVIKCYRGCAIQGQNKALYEVNGNGIHTTQVLNEYYITSQQWVSHLLEVF